MVEMEKEAPGKLKRVQPTSPDGRFRESRWEAVLLEGNHPSNFISTMFAIFSLLGGLKAQLPFMWIHVPGFC